MSDSAADFISAKGGPGAVARATGHTPGAVSVWKNRDRLPRSAWPEIMTAFPDVTLDRLKAMEAAAKPRPSPQQGSHAA